MEKQNLAKKTFAWIFVITFLIVEIIGLCFGKVIEGSLFKEITKWLVMGIVVAGIVTGLSYSIVGILLSRKNKLEK